MNRDLQVDVPEEEVGYIIRAIKDRLHNIGKSYQQNGRSYADDLDIASLCRFARQLGYEIDVTDNGHGFAINSNPL